MFPPVPRVISRKNCADLVKNSQTQDEQASGQGRAASKRSAVWGARPERPAVRGARLRETQRSGGHGLDKVGSLGAVAWVRSAVHRHRKRHRHHHRCREVFRDVAWSQCFGQHRKNPRLMVLDVQRGVPVPSGMTFPWKVPLPSQRSSEESQCPSGPTARHGRPAVAVGRGVGPPGIQDAHLGVALPHRPRV